MVQMTRPASISTYGALQTWHRGCYPLEAALIRDAEAVDAREECDEYTRMVGERIFCQGERNPLLRAMDDECAQEAPATLFDEVRD
jgi:hypothetical protein